MQFRAVPSTGEAAGLQPARAARPPSQRPPGHRKMNWITQAFSDLASSFRYVCLSMRH